MSQAGTIDVIGGNPSIPTEFIADIGTAAPIANQLEVLGTTQAAGTSPLHTTGSGNTLTIIAQISQAIAGTDATKIGLAAFDSSAFTVDANGFVNLNGGGGATTNIDVDAFTPPGTDPVVPSAGNIIMTGAQVATGVIGTNVIRTNSLAANTVTIEIQRSTAVAATDITKNGVSHFDSTDFSVDASGFVALNGAGAGQTITGDSGGALPPTAGNWNLFGQLAGTIQVFDTIGSGSTLSFEDRTWTTSLVVDPSSTVGLRGTFTTITLALAAAVSGQTIFIRPGTYTENLTLKAGVNLSAFVCDAQNAQVIIAGECNATFSGSCSISGIQFQHGLTGVGILVSGTDATIVNLINCFIKTTHSPGTSIANTSINTGAIINVLSCRGDISVSGGTVLYQNTGTGIINFYSSYFTNSGNSLSLNSAGSGSGASTVNIFSSFFSNGIACNSTSTTLISDSSVITPNTVCLQVTSTETASLICSNCYLDSGTASTINLVSGSGTINALNSTIKSSNTNAITGSGTIQYGNLSFLGTSSTNNATTQVPFIRSNDAVKITTPGAYPYTTVPQDGVILVDTSSARTITPLASPTTGQMHRIKDNVGSAAANNITITPSGKNIDGSASFVIGTNWGSVDIVYNGTQWNVL